MLECQAEIARFQRHQQVSGFHMLIVLNVNLFDTGRKLAGNTRDLTLHIGIVGVLVVAANKVPVSEKGSRHQQDQGNENEQSAFQLGGHVVALGR